jgi:hypothetical protein
MIAEAAYYLAQQRGFLGSHSLDDWLAAEQQVRQMISPDSSENQTKSEAAALAQTTQQAAADSAATPQQKNLSRFEKFAATQAAGDGIQGDALKKDKTVDEKIGANMADRK